MNKTIFYPFSEAIECKHIDDHYIDFMDVRAVFQTVKIRAKWPLMFCMAAHILSIVKNVDLNIFFVQLNQAIGSIEAIANASKEYILENTDLSAEKAETIWRFFRDPKYYLSPRIN